jgi:hypothetical protein
MSGRLGYDSENFRLVDAMVDYKRR